MKKKLFLFPLLMLTLTSCQLVSGKPADDSGVTSTSTSAKKDHSIELSRTSLTIAPGGSKKLYAVPADGAEITSWTSSDEEIATVDADGTVHAIKEGTTSVRVRTKYANARCSIIVQEKSKKTTEYSVSFEKDDVDVPLFGAAKVTANIFPFAPLSYNSSNTDVAVVVDDVVYGYSEGDAVITACYGDSSASYNVHVSRDPYIDPSKEVEYEFDLSGADSMFVGSSSNFVLTYNYRPASLVWTSSNPSVASVTVSEVSYLSANVKALKAGSTTITATYTREGKDYSASLDVEVNDKHESITSGKEITLTTLNSNRLPKTSNTTDWMNRETYPDVVYLYSLVNKKVTLRGEDATIASLAGILAQSGKPEIFVAYQQSHLNHLKYLQQKMGFYVIEKDALELIDMYYKRNAFSGYVEYKPGNNNTITYATTIAGQEKLILVSSAIKEEINSLGIPNKRTVGSGDNSTSIFNNYRTTLNKKFAVNLAPAIGGPLRDYCIANKALCTWFSYDRDVSSSFPNTIRDFLDTNACIFGWGEHAGQSTPDDIETSYVKGNSDYSVVTVPSDFAYNLSFTSAYRYADTVSPTYKEYAIEQTKHTDRTVAQIKAANPNATHYLAVMMSDGDNLQWVTNDFGTDTRFFGSHFRGNFPMTWGISPTMADLAPATVRGFYENATANDQFISGPGGFGYVNISQFNSASLDEYASITAGYMERIGLKCAAFLDRGINQNDYISRLAKFASKPQIDGGVILHDDSQYVSGHGTVYWQNDKPFITARETLWYLGDQSKDAIYGYTDRVAARINGYANTYNPSQAGGYTLLVPHAWSNGTMPYINRLTHLLNNKVELVTVGEMVALMKANVAHTNGSWQTVPGDTSTSAALTNNSVFYNDYASMKVATKSNFLFETDTDSWLTMSNGLQYDHAQFVTQIENPDSGVVYVYSDQHAIKLDGSDNFGIPIQDGIPNALMLNKFNFSNKPRTMTIKIADCPKYDKGGKTLANKDVAVRVVLTKPDGSSTVLKDGFINGGLSPITKYGGDYYLLDKNNSTTFEWHDFSFSIPAINSDFIISIEQNDSGEGSGEIVWVRAVDFK